MKPYEKYKDSGVEWLGEIPEHWEVNKFKRLFVEKKKQTNVNLNCGSISYGKVVYKDDERIPEATKRSYQVLSKGDFLINPLNLNYDLISLRIALSDIDVVVSSGYIILQNRIKLDKNYYKWLLLIFDVVYMKTLGAGVRQTLSFTHLANCELVFPTLKEQIAIAHFLEDKTAKIDQAIAIKQQQIELLKERKQIIIQEAVTKGLDKTVKMKDSGVEWIGEIPEHWEILPGLRFFRENKRTNKGMKESKVLSLSYGNIIIKPEEKLVGLVPESFETYQIVFPDDIIIRCTDLQNDQTSLRTGLAKNKGIITSAYINISIIGENHPEYLHSYLHFVDITKVLYRFGSGLRQNLSFSDFKRMPILKVPFNEQLQIVEFLQKASLKIEKAIEMQLKEIEKLKEYKLSLIDGVVTGKVKVC
ncbi:MAG: restriction endonuclease subunit S [Flavobacteriaceae bacterium]